MELKNILKNGTSIRSSGTTGPAKEIHQSPEKIKKANQVARDVQRITSSSKVYTVCKLDHAGGLLAQTLPASLGIDPSVATQAAQATHSWAQRNPNTAKFLTNVGTGVATSVATGYAMQQIAGDPEETGSMAGLRTEGASSFDPLRVYAAERGIADSDISKYFTFGNTAEAGNMPLFQQQTIGVA